MAINQILPILIGAIKTRNTIKDRNDDAYDEATGNFIDIASAEFYRSERAKENTIEKKKNFFYSSSFSNGPQRTFFFTL